MNNTFVALGLFFIVTLGGAGRLAAEEDADLRIIVDQLEVPVMKMTVGQTQRIYPELKGFKRLVYEPWSKFSYRISSTFIRQGHEASQLKKFLDQQIANKSPTGWVGHEANLMITVMNGDSVEYQISVSKNSRSSVYFEEGRPRIGHFSPTERVSKLLKLDSVQKQKIDVEQGVAAESDRAGG
jgi:hypothetical protein